MSWFGSLRRRINAERTPSSSPCSSIGSLVAAFFCACNSSWAREQLGDAAPSLKPLGRVLDLFIDPRLPPAPQAAAPQADAVVEASAVGPTSKARTRGDVLQDIRLAREWFETHEPSSPVAVFLKQAERMVGQRFSQVADAIPLELLQKWDASEVRAETSA